MDFVKKNKPFSIYCFNTKWINKKSSEKFKNKKRLKLTIENIDLKQAKICIFLKGLDHGFCKKIKTFLHPFFNAK